MIQVLNIQVARIIVQYSVQNIFRARLHACMHFHSAAINACIHGARVLQKYRKAQAALP